MLIVKINSSCSLHQRSSKRNIFSKSIQCDLPHKLLSRNRWLRKKRHEIAPQFHLPFQPLAGNSAEQFRCSHRLLSCLQRTSEKGQKEKIRKGSRHVCLTSIKTKRWRVNRSFFQSFNHSVFLPLLPLLPLLCMYLSLSLCPSQLINPLKSLWKWEVKKGLSTRQGLALATFQDSIRDALCFYRLDLRW